LGLYAIGKDAKHGLPLISPNTSGTDYSHAAAAAAAAADGGPSN
jgi:hypothetical protein